MTRDEHERERRAFWDACCAATVAYPTNTGDGEGCAMSVETEAMLCAALADAKLAERDKRWPVPEEPKTSADQDADGANEADECETCKFRTLGPFQEPCRSCSAISLTTTSHWEPAK